MKRNELSMNIRSQFLPTCLVFLVSFYASAQEAGAGPSRYLDVTMGIGSSLFNTSLSYHYAWKSGAKQRLELGVGLRASLNYATGKYFITAPARLVKGESGPQALFKESIPANIDSLELPIAKVSSINVMLSVKYQVSKKFAAGFNIDVIGISFGARQSGTYINGSTSNPAYASPSPFNLLLVGENDLGSLNSEFYAAYSINERLTVKLGAQHVFMEFTTDTKVQQFPEPNDRFRITPTMVCAGMALRIERRR